MDEFTIRTGVNVSHWLSQSDKRSEERKNYITKADFDTIAATGFDHVRIPIDEEQLWDSLGNKEPEAFELLHNAINWAFAAKLRVIVDLHIIRSHHFIAASNPLWTDPAENYQGLSKSTVETMRSYANGYFTKEILEKIMSPAIKVANEDKLPLYCGEFGVYPTIPEDVMLRWYSDVCDIFNNNNIAYCHWCYKGDFPVVNEKGLPNRKLVSVLTAK